GLGAIYEIELLDERGADVFLLGERGRFAPFGVNGGSAAALNRFSWTDDGGTHEPPMASKITGVKLKRGHRVRLETPGGGGFGDPT
ncbi:hydantoinase B/oxoprolinase family protein, partial [Stenotrophomonas maltophilia]|uniref:hydantoinase B/oxoprolinase family protein n=1 Tax=Stenotrophomonas maltophilia TaxID=40324 RepID=UPI0013DAD877